MSKSTWLDLNDNSGARLKLAWIPVDGERKLHLFITNLSNSNPKWQRSIDELEFRAGPNRKYLVKRVSDTRLQPSYYRRVFPHARLAQMDAQEYFIQFKSATPSSSQSIRPSDMEGVRLLGFNARGQEVFEGVAGRFFMDNGVQVQESAQRSSRDFLRLNHASQPAPQGQDLLEAQIDLAMGFAYAMDAGVVQHSEDYDHWIAAVYPDWGTLGEGQRELINTQMYAAIDAAMLRYVHARHDVANGAYLPMARLYDHLPPYRGRERGLGAMPQPLAVAAQRLLGDTAGKMVLYPNAFDGSSFTFLPATTQIHAYGAGWSAYAIEREGVHWSNEYNPHASPMGDAAFFNADPVFKDGRRQDHLDAVRLFGNVVPGGRVVWVLAGDNESGRLSNESEKLLRHVAQHYTIDDIFESAPILSRKSGGTHGLRVMALRNLPCEGDELLRQQAQVQAWCEQGLPVLSSWEAIKTHLDETISRIDLREAESQKTLLERVATMEAFQKPYISFSRLGEARTMAPANLQGPMQQYLTQVEGWYGAVDEFVSAELGMGHQTLSQRFSPEQIDGVAIMVSRYKVGRSSILADDTGIGKGRQLAAAATWANKQGMNVVFVTDRANLFSDLARDLTNIGEWERFRPLVLNSDGEITVDVGGQEAPRLLAKGASPAEMGQILAENISLEQARRNMVFLTYSQISTEESEKALWLKNQLGNALVIFDEAHVAAGSDSNIARHVMEIVSQAKLVQYASATWAKSHENLHIYQRAFPDSVSIGTLAETMRKGGDSFAEIYSSMLAAEGALIRREHDLSKLEVEMCIDHEHRAHNEAVSDLVADVLGAAAYVGNEMDQIFIRHSQEQVRRLKEAREARNAGLTVNLFKGSFASGSVIYQVMKGVQGALSAPYVADLAVQSLQKGMKPIIVSDATGEALVQALMQERGEVDAIKMPTLRDLLRHVILKRLSMVAVREMTPDELPEDETQPVVLDDAGAAPGDEPGDGPDEGAPVAAEPARGDVEEEGVEIEAAVAAATGEEGVPVQEERSDAPRGRGKGKSRLRMISVLSDEFGMPEAARVAYAAGIKEIEAKIDAVPEVPLMAIDVIAEKIRAAGFSVSELTGRKNSLLKVDGDEGNRYRLMPRNTSKKAVKATIRALNAGQVDAAIINRSVAAGVSMHASPHFADLRRRRLIEHMIPEDPVNRIQLLGRVNRYDQVSTPLISTASTGIFGEVRFLMMQNRKLARMSANVRSSRDNAMLLKGVTDLFNPVGLKAVRDYLTDNPMVASRLGITDEQIERDPDLVNRVTMRIPLLKVSQQEVVYGEINARFDEIVLQAELDGYNPLKPFEFNIRAKTAREDVFFGLQDDDASAFDAPVLVRTLKWTEKLNPLTLESVKNAYEASRQRLLESGYLQRTEEGAWKVNADLAERIVKTFHSMMRLAHMSSGIDSFEDAAVKTQAGRRAAIKHAWMRDCLPLLRPGAVISFSEEGRDWVVSSVITDIRVPDLRNPQDLMDMGKWKISLVTPGDAQARQVTLRSLLGNLKGEVSKGEITGDLNVSYSNRVARQMVEEDWRRWQQMFEFVPRGDYARTATCLTGNMYLASEWAAAVGKGNSTIYTDDAGLRHRVIMLPQEMSSLNLEFLPVRLHGTEPIKRFVSEYLWHEPTEEGYSKVLDTTFKSAMSQFDARSKRDSVVILNNKSSVMITCSVKDSQRLRNAIKSGDAAWLRQQPQGHGHEPLLVRRHASVREITRLNRGLGQFVSMLSQNASGADKKSKVALVVIRITGPQDIERAVKLLVERAGLEIYAAEGHDRERARHLLQGFMRERRDALRLLRDASTGQAAAPVPLVQAPPLGTDVARPQDPQGRDEEDDGAAAEARPVVMV